MAVLDCSLIWFKKSAMNAFRVALNQNRKNFKTEFFQNQKEIAVLFHSSLQISAFFFKPLSGAAVADERPCSLCSVSREQLIALHAQIFSEKIFSNKKFFCINWVKFFKIHVLQFITMHS